MTWINRIVKGIFSLFAVAILVSALLSRNLDVTQLPKKFLIILVVCIVLLIAILAIPPLRHRAKKIVVSVFKTIKNHLLAFAIIFCSLIILYQSILVLSIYAPPGFDPSYMMNLIWLKLHDPSQAMSYNYLSELTNNQLFFFVIYALALLTGGPHLGVLGLFNMICIDISILFTALAAYKKFGRSYGYATLFFSGLLLGFSPVVLITYTDTTVLPFVSFGLWLLASYKTVFSLQKQMAFGISLGSMFALTYLMKPSAIMPFIAAVIVFCLWVFQMIYQVLKQTKRIKTTSAIRIGSFLLAGALTFVGINFLFGKFVEEQTIFDYHDEMRMPLTHFAMMGLSQPHGGYSSADFQATRDAGDYNQKVAYNISTIKSRLESFGFTGYLSFLAQKYYYNTADGSFGFRKEGGSPLYQNRISDSDNLATKLLGRLYFSDGSYFTIYQFYSQIIWLFLVVLMLCSISSSSSYTRILWIAFMGGLIFLLIFEGGRSRYLIQFLPLCSILCSLGLHAVVKRLRLDAIHESHIYRQGKRGGHSVPVADRNANQKKTH